MKIFFRTIFYLSVIQLTYNAALSQAPLLINYQGIARDMTGAVISNKDMRVRITILDQSPNGNPVYIETKKVTTNKFGLFVVAIGGEEGLISRTGKMSEVDWSRNEKFIGIEIDPSGSNNFQNLGTSQLLSVPYSFYSLKSKDGVPNMEGNAGKVLTNNGIKAIWDTIYIPQYKAGQGIDINGTTIQIPDSVFKNATKLQNIPLAIDNLQDGGVITWDQPSNTFIIDNKRMPGKGLTLNDNKLEVMDTALFNASKIMNIPVDTRNKQQDFVLSWDAISNTFRLTPRIQPQQGLALDGDKLSIKDTALFNAAKIMNIPVDTLNKQQDFVLSWDANSNSFRLTPRLQPQQGLALDGDKLSIKDTALFNASKIMNIPVDTLNKQQDFVLSWDAKANSIRLTPRLQPQEGLALEGDKLSIKDTAIFNASKIMNIPVDTLNKQQDFVLSWDANANSFRLTPRLQPQQGLALEGDKLSIKDTALFNASKIMNIPVDTLNKQQDFVLSWDAKANSFRLTPRIQPQQGLALEGDKLSIKDTALFNASKIMNIPVDTLNKQQDYVLSWDANANSFLLSPRLQPQEGLALEGDKLFIKDTAIFNARKLLNYPLDSSNKGHNYVMYWDSLTNRYQHQSVDSLMHRSDLITQDGNEFGREMEIGTKDTFDILFKIDDQVMASVKRNGELNANYVKPNKQFIAPAKFHPTDPFRLYNGEISYNGDWLPPYAFEEDPRTGIALENMEAPSITLINKGRPMLRTYWESGDVDESAIIQGFGKNRLSIQSISSIVHIAQNGRYEWESIADNYIDFIGYRASTHKGKTIRISTERLSPATPLAILAWGKVNALNITDSLDNLKTHFNYAGWLGISTAQAKAPLHVSFNERNYSENVVIFENNLGQEIMTSKNDRNTFFGGKVQYRNNTSFESTDSMVLVSKKYVDEQIENIVSNLLSNNILVDPDTILENYEINLPASPSDGMEYSFYFGGKINTGIVVKTLQLPSLSENILLSAPLPENILAGQVIRFHWFASSSKWYRKE